MGRSFLKKSLAVVLCIVLFSALPIHPAQAFGIGDLFCALPLIGLTCFIPDTLFTTTVRSFILFSATIGYLGLWFASIAAALLLQIGGFTQNSFVVTGWPFLQGVANLGFIMALLYIAFSTATGIGNYGAQRMLPRLLIAALLINFSLVIGGLIIDASRLVMAAMIRTSLNNPGITEIGSNLLAQSPSFYDPSNDPNFVASDPRGSRYRQKPMSVYVITRNTLSPLEDVSTTAIVPGCLPTPSLVGDPYAACYLFKNNNYEIILALIMGNSLVWALFIGLIVVVAGLFVRYIALVLLLMVSPLAYLAIAFPGTESMAKQWWHQFIKFVLFGPISLFVLLLMTKVIDAGRQVSAPALNGTLGGNVAAEFLVKVPITVGLFWGLCFLATKTAMTFGNAGAQGALNFGKRVARVGSGIGLATGGAKLARKGVGAAAGAVGTYAKDQVTRPVRSFANTYMEGFQQKLGMGKFSKYDKQGNLKPGKEDVGSRLGKRFGFSTKQVEQRDESDAIRIIPDDATMLTEPAYKKYLSPNMLRQPHIGDTLSKKQRVQILTNPLATHDQKLSLVKNINAVQNMSDKEKTDILNLPADLDTNAPADRPTNLPTSGPTVNTAQATTNAATNSSNHALNAAARDTNKQNETANRRNRELRDSMEKSLETIKNA